jgi:hypothetical protein
MANKTKALQRSKAYLERNGWTCCIVERYLPARGAMKFPRRIDAFSFGDILACKRVTYTEMCGVALVQAFPQARWKDHIAKIAAIPEAQTWKEAGGLILVHGWSLKPKGGKRGALKVWTLRAESI